MFDKVVFPQASILLEQARAEKREAYKREHIITLRRSYKRYSPTLCYTFLADKVHACFSLLLTLAWPSVDKGEPPHPHTLKCR